VKKRRRRKSKREKLHWHKLLPLKLKSNKKMKDDWNSKRKRMLRKKCPMSVAESVWINALETNSMISSIRLRDRKKEKLKNNLRKLSRNFKMTRNLSERKTFDI